MKKCFYVLCLLVLVLSTTAVSVFAASIDPYKADGILISTGELHGQHEQFVVEGGGNIGYTSDGDYVVFKDVDFGDNDKLLNLSSDFCREEASTNVVEFRLGGLEGTLLGEVEVVGSGDWSTYETFTEKSVVAPSGVHDLYVVFKCDTGNTTGGAGNYKTIKIEKTDKTGDVVKPDGSGAEKPTDKPKEETKKPADPKTEEKPQTGDASALMYFILAGAATAGATRLRRK